MKARAVAVQFKMLTARAPTTAIVASDANDWTDISTFARVVNGNVSVGLNADEFVIDKYK